MSDSYHRSIKTRDPWIKLAAYALMKMFLGGGTIYHENYWMDLTCVKNTFIEIESFTDSGNGLVLFKIEVPRDNKTVAIHHMNPEFDSFLKYLENLKKYADVKKQHAWVSHKIVEGFNARFGKFNPKGYIACLDNLSENHYTLPNIILPGEDNIETEMDLIKYLHEYQDFCNNVASFIMISYGYNTDTSC